MAEDVLDIDHLKREKKSKKSKKKRKGVRRNETRPPAADQILLMRSVSELLRRRNSFSTSYLRKWRTMPMSKDLKENILKEQTVPLNLDSVKSVDTGLVKLLEGKNEAGRDKGMEIVQSKIRDVMGRFSRVWSLL